MLYRLLKGFIYIKGLRQNLLSLPSEYHHIFERLLKLVNMNRKVSIYASCEIKMPMAVGLKNPIILIPYKILGNLTEEQLSYVMLHELSHIKRWDDWANLVQRIIEVFYFWHPAILWINKRLNLEREIACDDYVITLSNEPKSYARCLTRLIELDISASQKMMANGAAWNKKHITKRFKKIIEDGRDRSSRPSILAVSLAACVLFFAASLFISVMPSVKLVKPSSGLKQIDNQSEMVKVPNPPDTHAYIEKTKPKSKDEKRISSNEANKRIAIESSTEVVKESQKSSHNAHDIPLLETKPPFSDPMKDLSKTDEPVNAPGYDITLEVISPSDYTLESHDDKQAKSFPEEGGSSPSLKRTLSENVKQGIDGIGGFIKEVGESTGKSFSELGNMSSSMGKEIALGTKSNFSNMKRAAVKKLGIAGKNTKKISGS